MLVLTKLIVAHLMGDFLLQPTSWVKEKEVHKSKSIKFYLHFLIHGALVLLFLWDMGLWPVAVSITLSHAVIDLLKTYSQRPKNYYSMVFPGPISSLIEHPRYLVYFFSMKTLIFESLSTPKISGSTQRAFLSSRRFRPSFFRLFLKNWTAELNLSKKYSLKKSRKVHRHLGKAFCIHIRATRQVGGDWILDYG